MENTTENQLYKNEKLNKFAKTNPFYVVGLFAVISSIVYVYGWIEMESSIHLKIVLLLSGILAFTLAEYMFHRFLYHSGDNYKNEDNWQYLIHGVHHLHPNEKHILAMPIPLALILSTAFFGLFYLMMGWTSLHFFPGFILGYAGYIFIHVMIHTRRPPNNIFKHLWRHHHEHHYRDENRAFGVSSQLWDIIFRTMPPKGGNLQEES